MAKRSQSHLLVQLRAENAHLRQAISQIERVLQPVDHALHRDTVGRAREIALIALNASDLSHRIRRAADPSSYPQNHKVGSA